MFISDFSDVEACTNALDAFKETVENRIQAFESSINNSIKTDWANTESRII